MALSQTFFTVFRKGSRKRYSGNRKWETDSMKRSEKQVAEGILRHRIHYKRKRTVFLTSGSRKEEDVSKHRLRFLDLRYQRTNLLT